MNVVDNQIFKSIWKTYKNKHFTSRDYECTNIVFLQSDKVPDDNWVECERSEIDEMNCQMLWIDGFGRKFGYM